MQKKYISNITEVNLVFKNGYLYVPHGGFAAISHADMNSSEFITAHERGWIEVSDVAPEVKEFPPVKTVKVQSRAQGMTAAELAEDLAKDKQVVPKAKSEALGVENANGTEPKPCIVTALGQEESVEPTTETETARRGRKPKAEKAVD